MRSSRRRASELHPLVVLLDIRLPGISGIETLERIVKKDPDIKCLMISMVHETDTIVECIKKGAHDYMTKEIEYESVRKKSPERHGFGKAQEGL